MNDVKDLFSRVLDADTPRPVATRDEMLAVAHRAAARRRARHITAVCASVALVVAAATAAPHWLGRGGDGLTTGPAATAPPNRPTPTTAPAITPERHAQSMLTTLLGHVPEPFATPSAPPAAGSTRPAKEAHVMSPTQQMIANTDVYLGTKSGVMSVVVTVRPGAVPTGDLCVTAPASHHAEEGCTVVTAANGDRIRVSWRDLSPLGRIEYAARFYQGGTVVVQQTPSAMQPDSVPIGRILSQQRLAAVAADPAFWPTNLTPFPSGS